jgi:hypothetical protein
MLNTSPQKTREIFDPVQAVSAYELGILNPLIQKELNKLLEYPSLCRGVYKDAIPSYFLTGSAQGLISAGKAITFFAPTPDDALPPIPMLEVEPMGYGAPGSLRNLSFTVNGVELPEWLRTPSEKLFTELLSTFATQYGFTDLFSKIDLQMRGEEGKRRTPGDQVSLGLYRNHEIDVFPDRIAACNKVQPSSVLPFANLRVSLHEFAHCIYDRKQRGLSPTSEDFDEDLMELMSQLIYGSACRNALIGRPEERNRFASIPSGYSMVNPNEFHSEVFSFFYTGVFSAEMLLAQKLGIERNDETGQTPDDFIAKLTTEILNGRDEKILTVNNKIPTDNQEKEKKLTNNDPTAPTPEVDFSSPIFWIFDQPKHIRDQVAQLFGFNVQRLETLTGAVGLLRSEQAALHKRRLRKANEKTTISISNRPKTNSPASALTI